MWSEEEKRNGSLSCHRGHVLKIGARMRVRERERGEKGKRETEGIPSTEVFSKTREQLCR